MLQTKKHADGKTQSDRIWLIQNTFLSRLHLVIDAGQTTFEVMPIDMFLVLNRLTMLLQLLLEAKLDSVILRSWLKNATTKPGLQANNVVSTLETLSDIWWTKLRTLSPSSQITIAEGSFCCFLVFLCNKSSCISVDPKKVRSHWVSCSLLPIDPGQCLARCHKKKLCEICWNDCWNDWHWLH